MAAKRILPLVVDEKMALLNESLVDMGVEIELPDRQSPLQFLRALIERALRGEPPEALLVRYLNSPPTLLQALSWWISTAATVAFARITGIKVLWLLHNVDRETIQPFGVLTRSLRSIVAALSSSILVTDPLLVEVARRCLKAAAPAKIDWITFGERKTSFDRLLDALDSDDTADVVSLIAQVRKRYPDAMIGFCPTSAGAKFVHLKYAVALVEASRDAGSEVHLVIVGPTEQALEFCPGLTSNERIHLISRRVNYDPRVVAPHVDCYWRSLSDQSVSYTLYEAASVGLPVLTMKCGFLGEAVPHYRLGASLDVDFSNLREALSELRGWDRRNAYDFLGTHSWAVAAGRIARLV